MWHGVLAWPTGASCHNNVKEKEKKKPGQECSMESHSVFLAKKVCEWGEWGWWAQQSKNYQKILGVL